MSHVVVLGGLVLEQIAITYAKFDGERTRAMCVHSNYKSYDLCKGATAIAEIVGFCYSHASSNFLLAAASP